MKFVPESLWMSTRVEKQSPCLCRDVTDAETQTIWFETVHTASHCHQDMTSSL